jgi:hypothetical protein
MTSPTPDTVPTPSAVVTRDRDNRAFQPMQVVVGIALDVLFGQATAITVPANKRLIIEFLDGRAEVPPGQTIIHVRVIAESGGESAEHCYGAQLQGSSEGADNFTFNHATLAYADPGTDVIVIVNRSDTAGFGSAQVALTGHFVDLA